MALSPRRVGQTLPPLPIAVTANGAPINLAGASFTLALENVQSGLHQAGTGTFTITNAAAGLISYAWAAGDLSAPGQYVVYLIADIPAYGQPYVSKGDPLTVLPGVPSVTAAGSARAAQHAMAVDLLTNIATYGYNGAANVNNGLGGLYVDWTYTGAPTGPNNANWNGNGVTDYQLTPPINPPRHDPLTDLRYLHNLYHYQALNPGDTTFAAALAAAIPYTKNDWAGTHDNRGWVYDILIDLYRLSGDSFWKTTAQGLATYYYTKAYHANVTPIPTYYATSSTHPQGYARTDWSMEIACALLHGSVYFNQPAWKTAGYNILNYLYAYNYIAAYHCFPAEYDTILNSDLATLNPNPIFYGGSTTGGIVRLPEHMQMAQSLCHAYSVTGDSSLLAKAQDLLDYLQPVNDPVKNLLGIWDVNGIGYWRNATFPGSSFQSPGVPFPNMVKKEPGRMALAIQAFHNANAYLSGRYAAAEATMLALVTNPAYIYYTPGHGVLGEVNTNWTLFVDPNGVPETWVTTEAMGIALEGIFCANDQSVVW